jgi:DNA-binding NtrC family response regulator
MKKIMLIEDDEDIADLVDIILSSKYKVKIHKNGFGIIKVLQQYLPDVILIDNSVGQKTAADIISEIKSSCILPIPPYILFSAHPNIEAITKQIGAVGYLAKPFEIEQLYTCIEKALDLSAAGTP